MQVWLSCCQSEQLHPQQVPLATLHWCCWLRSRDVALSSLWRVRALTCPAHPLTQNGTCTMLMCRRAHLYILLKPAYLQAVLLAYLMPVAGEPLVFACQRVCLHTRQLPASCLLREQARRQAQIFVRGQLSAQEQPTLPLA